MDIVVHMTECKPHSTVASARVARFISETLSILLVDTGARAESVLGSNATINRLIIVNGPMAFCDFLEPLSRLVKKAMTVIWVQQDYTIMPPSADSKAESPFRKVFADRKLRPIFWTTCEHNIKTDQDKYINWNELTYRPQPILEEGVNKVLYYGAFREKRLESFNRFFRDPKYPLAISTTTLRSKKFRELGTGEVFVQPFDDVVVGARPYAASLYIEDERSHREFHSPANRFYEMLSAGVPMFFDHQCLPMLDKAGITVPDKWVVKDQAELSEKFGFLDKKAAAQEQRDMWSSDYVHHLKQRLKEIWNVL